ncbi:histidine phosphatase family protein [Paenibacillus allorhizosphaerae]|uniref:Phosphoserine phosphatase 1 n=1 Tax=Paenibacillus allorhizosphaerae TaxID=2849866 RepID=A0ABM8VTM4_9BACL|nr:histidine phosphatase family protein [Paenibacillus allorhizosphaerae]CAG7657976.1 Phosphoserine phosphatase 1 [Paenibacillus allorhizosphaerae]
MTTFYIVRHGETEWNSTDRYCGSTDISLSDTGAEQANQTALFLACTPIDVVYASTLTRARETAEPIALAKGLHVQIDRRIVEVDFGMWEGLKAREIRTRYPQAWKQWHEEPESYPAGTTGESADAVFRRMNLFFEEIAARHLHERVLVVGHSVSIRIYLAGMMSMPMIAYRRLVHSNTGISVLETSKEGMRILLLNCRYDTFAEQ